MENEMLTRLMDEKKKWEGYQRVGDIASILFFFVMIGTVFIASMVSTGWVLAGIVIGVSYGVGVPLACFGLFRSWKLFKIERKIKKITHTC
jgi:O-antigen/teichoic acid export membrane protein